MYHADVLVGKGFALWGSLKGKKPELERNEDLNPYYTGVACKKITLKI